MAEKMLYSVGEAADLLNLSKASVYLMVKAGVLGHIRGEGKGPTNIYIPKEEIDKYIHSRVKYGHAVTLPKERADAAKEGLKKAREARANKGRRKKGLVPLETTEGTIYALGLKARTFNLLHAAGYLTIPEVDLGNPDVAKKLACLPGFGIACWNDLEAALARKIVEKKD